MNDKAQELYAVIRGLRTAFNRLKSVGDRLHGDLGVTSAMRAVLETLSEEGAQSVPAIAARKSVSRQHIQVNADALLDRGLIAHQENPNHKRSHLLVLTEAGQALFATMRQREAARLENIAAPLDLGSLRTTRETLDRMNAMLADLLSSADSSA
jgi:DNA-binding MarR family transcriptional regulator